METAAFESLSREQLIGIIATLTPKDFEPAAVPEPARKQRKPKKTASPIQYWTPAETEAFFCVVRASKNVRDLALFEITYHRGLRSQRGRPAEMSDLQLDCFRHSCATHLLDHDVDMREVQHHLRHTDIRNTTIYAQVSDAKRRKTAERLYRQW